MTDSRSTLDDEVDDETIEDSRETCHFWDSRNARCHYELVSLNSGPCADCPEPGPDDCQASHCPPSAYQDCDWPRCAG
jgi:hypothetical protein